MLLFRRIACIVTLCLLSACSRAACPPVAGPELSVYQRCLARGESLESATQIGPYTVLDIAYSSGPGSLGYRDRFKRLLLRGKTVVDQADGIQRWEERDDVVLFADFVDSKKLDEGRLHLVYEQAGRAIVESIPADSYYANKAFPYGFPLSPQVRYFSNLTGRGDAGFLLQASPARKTMLPPGLSGQRNPPAHLLAAMAPDGKAYAYTDNFTTPSVLLVVGTDGAMREPVPIPMPPALSKGINEDNPFAPLWQWFAGAFSWQRDAQGRWIVLPAGPRGASAAPVAVEDYFVDASRAYRHCLAGDNPACRTGWRLKAAADAQGEACCAALYAYTPSMPARAFGAPIVELNVGRTAAWGAGYDVLLDAPAASVAAAIDQRLAHPGTAFIRVDACLKTDDGRTGCRKRIAELTGHDDPGAAEVITQLLRSAAENPVYVTPGAAFGIYPDKAGRSWLMTLARYAPPGRR